MDRGPSPLLAGPPSSITSPPDDVATLMASLDWSRDKVERLCRYSTDQYTISNLRSIAAAMDPAKNPRLQSVYERNRKGGGHG